MPIYHRHRMVHIHIPKTGGTAIERHFHKLGDLEWGPASWIGRKQIRGRWCELQHLTWDELGELSELRLDTYCSFAVVRDPYSRMLSDFLWRRRLVKDRPQATILSFKSFRDFLMAIPDDIDTAWYKHLDAADCEQAGFLIHVRPQYQYVCDPTGEHQVDQLLRFERLDLDFNQFLQRFGMHNDIVTRPRQQDLKAYYDRELLDRVETLYLQDFESFGYERI